MLRQRGFNLYDQGCTRVRVLIACHRLSGVKVAETGTARLPNYRLAFTRKSVRWNAGVADILECPGFWVYGVLYEIHTDKLTKLDRKEGAPKAYQRIDISVRVDSEGSGRLGTT